MKTGVLGVTLHVLAIVHTTWAGHEVVGDSGCDHKCHVQLEALKAENAALKASMGGCDRLRQLVPALERRLQHHKAEREADARIDHQVVKALGLEVPDKRSPNAASLAMLLAPRGPTGVGSEKGIQQVTKDREEVMDDTLHVNAVAAWEKTTLGETPSLPMKNAFLRGYQAAAAKAK